MSDITKAEIISLVVRFGFLTVVSYFSIKWFVKQLDPTNQQRKSAMVKVSCSNKIF